MTLNQLQTLSEEEIAICLHVVNVIAPPAAPKMEFEPRHLTWFRHDMLVKKLLDVFPRLLPEGHSTYVSLMAKLGVHVEIKAVEPPLPSTSSICPSNEITSSIEPPLDTATQ